jgi:hypothetical protein
VDEARQQDKRALDKHRDEIEKERRKVAQYEEGLAFFRQRIEQRQYEIGRLDERLGS